MKDPTAPERLYLNLDMERAVLQPLAGGSAVVFSARNPLRRDHNEDGAAVISCGDASGVIAVADGLGGSSAGGQAAELALRCLVEYLGRASEPANLREAIIDGIEEANQRVQDIGVGAGTTVAVVEIQGNEIRPYHVGDSTILVVGQRGKLKLQTVPHSPVGYAVEAGVIGEAEAMHHAQRHIVSNVLGNPEMRIELGATLKLASRDTLIVASDGLSDNLHTDEILDCSRTGSLDTVGGRLVSRARARMDEPHPDHPSKPDDLTFVVFRPPILID